MTNVLVGIAKVAIAVIEAGKEAWDAHAKKIEAKRKAVNEAARKDLEFLVGPGSPAINREEEK